MDGWKASGAGATPGRIKVSRDHPPGIQNKHDWQSIRLHTNLLFRDFSHSSVDKRLARWHLLIPVRTPASEFR